MFKNIFFRKFYLYALRIGGARRKEIGGGVLIPGEGACFALAVSLVNQKRKIPRPISERLCSFKNTR